MTKQLRFATLGIVAALLVASCSETTEPSTDGTVQFTTSISGQSITSSIRKDVGVVQGGIVIDSIHIDSVRVLISRIKLQRSEDDTMNGGRDVKVGPAVISFSKDTTKVVFSHALPEGLYRKVKLEKHKLSANEATQYATDPVFGDFAFPERLTLIVDGTLYGSDGVNEFTLTDDQVENMWLKFEPDLQITASTTTSVEWNFDAISVFKSGGRLRDPRSIDDIGDITKEMKKCWRIFKRH